MKSKRITFTPGHIIPDGQSLSGHQKLPALTLPDGSQILLYDFDPVASHGRRYKRRALKLPTLDTRYEFGAWIEKTYNHQVEKPNFSGYLHDELTRTAGKLSWLLEAVKAGAEVSADDIREIRTQLMMARTAIKNVKP
jgi:hypothetical protein